MDIRDVLDASFGEGPPLRSPVDLLAPGRAALRRRRLGTGAAALTVALLLGGTAYAALGGSLAPRTADDVIVASEPPTQTPTESPTATPTKRAADTVRTGKLVDGVYLPGPDEEPVQDGELVRLLSHDGRVVVLQPGAVIVERIPNPLGHEPPSYSAGVAVELQGETTWFLLEEAPGYGDMSSKPAGGAYPSLAAWVADQLELRR